MPSADDRQRITNSMAPPYVRLVGLALVTAGVIPLLTGACSAWLAHDIGREMWSGVALAGGLGIGIALAVLILLSRFGGWIDNVACEQVRHAHAIPPRFIYSAILVSALLSLFLELVMIRWQATVFEFFAFYKNFSLLACFAGLGLGYATSHRDRLHLVLVVPLIALQFAFLIGMRHGMGTTLLSSLMVLPFLEQLNMGVQVATSYAHGLAIYAFLAVVFLLTALTFVPIGQLCGCLMERAPRLRAYGGNLLGSALGVMLIFGVSFYWLPPLIWFILSFALILVFVPPLRSVLMVSLGAAAIALAALAWPVSPLWNRIYSPYQMLELGYGDNGYLVIRAAGHYYQRVHNLARSNLAVDSQPALSRIRDYYELPYQFKPRPERVAVVGSGTGNDVAAALRCDAGHVDAIEIDPAILMAGKAHHPEYPYDDPRVATILNDARSFLRSTTNRYDMIVYGLLDSHTLLSHASSVRLDSFVYTVEGLKEARSRLNEGGVIALSFSVLTESLGKKILLMMRDAFDGRDPVCISAGYDGAMLFIQAEGGALSTPPDLLARTSFRDVRPELAASTARADVSTDDWPFFYMPRRVYPVSYLPMILMVLVLCGLMGRQLVTGGGPLADLRTMALFFLLGGGFMLVETKAITEMGLVFGNTWQIIGIVIIGVMVMAFLANYAVDRFRIRRSPWMFVLLLITLALGYLVARHGGLPSTAWGRIGTTVILTCPMFFSGIVFSTNLVQAPNISSVMAANLVGAIAGGLLEYNSMYFGFGALYMIAAALYVVALVLSLRRTA